MKRKTNCSESRSSKGPLQLLDEMYIYAKIMLAASLSASVLIPLAVLAICLICGGGGELWYAGDPSIVAETIIGGVIVSIGGAILLDVAHKKDRGE